MTLAGLWLPCRLPLFCSRISVPMGAPCDASDSREICLLWCALCDVISIDGDRRPTGGARSDSRGSRSLVRL